MFQTINKHLQRRVHLVGLIAVCLIIVSVLALWHEQRHDSVITADTLSTQTNGAQSQDATTPTDSGVVATEITLSSGAPKTKTAAKPAAGQPVTSGPTNEVISPTPASNPEPATVQVKLHIDDVYKGDVALADGKNHCDVLTRALETGVLSSLEMRYNSTYKTQAVYKINGVGDSDTVWWAYKVNGKSPPLGCSHVKVRSGDSINWEYVKN